MTNIPKAESVKSPSRRVTWILGVSVTLLLGLAVVVGSNTPYLGEVRHMLGMGAPPAAELLPRSASSEKSQREAAKREQESVSAPRKPVSAAPGTGIVARPATASGTTRASKAKTEEIPLSGEAAEVKARLDSLKQEYNASFNRFLNESPVAAQWQNTVERYKTAFREEAAAAVNKDLRKWIDGTGSKTAGGDAGTVERRQEVGRLRQYLFLEQMNSLIGDSSVTEPVSSWYQSRIGTLSSKDADPANAALANDWSAIGNALFPDAATASTLLTTADRQALISQYSEKKGLGTVDATMPQGADEHLRKLMRFVILQNVAENAVAGQMPDALRELAAAQRQLLQQWNLLRPQPQPTAKRS